MRWGSKSPEDPPRDKRGKCTSTYRGLRCELNEGHRDGQVKQQVPDPDRPGQTVQIVWNHVHKKTGWN